MKKVSQNKKPRREPPYGFVLDSLESRSPYIKPMFGHHAVFLEDRIILFLINKDGNSDNGICFATSAKHIESLKKQFPSLTHLEAYGPKETGWLLLPVAAPDFEETALSACDLILKNDARIGRLSKS